jgi:hypothetical protein
MMVPKKSLMLAGAALAMFGATASAQSQSGKVFARYNKPLKSLTLDLDTGTITRGPQVTNRKGGTVTDFDNNDLGGFVGVDTGSGVCKWIDAAVKGTGSGRTAGVVNNSDLMNDIVFAYCSAKLTPGSGGPGGSLALHFYEGYTVFGGAATTGVAHFTLTGLPGNSASSSFFGGFNCFFIQVRFAQLVCFADGPVGYGWRFIDAGFPTANPLSSVLAGTWPFLSCTASCSNSVLGIDLQGMTDLVDEYCPVTTLRATFTFGTTSGSFTSMSMAVDEVVDQTASITACTGTPAAPDVLTTTAAVSGASWTATVTTGLTRAKTGTWTLFFGDTPLGKPAGILISQFPRCPEPTGPISGNFGTSKAGRKLLCNIDCASPSKGSCSGVPIGGPKGSKSACSSKIPKKIGFVCNAWCAQAVVIGNVTAGIQGGGNSRLTSSVQGVLGTNFP